MTTPKRGTSGPRSLHCSRGLLVSIEGITGVGKTHLTACLQAEEAGTGARAPVVLEGFSQRLGAPHVDLGREILAAMADAADGDRFLRAGHPAAETLLLLAIKMHDYEKSMRALLQGRVVIEGRSLHSIAVYQSLILHADDDEAFDEARAILEVASQWRLLPDLAILITDDVATAVRRAERRDRKPYTTEEWRMHSRAAALFEQIAAADPERLPRLDRRAMNTGEAVRLMRTWISQRERSVPCLVEPWRTDHARDAACVQQCHLARSGEQAGPTTQRGQAVT